MYTTLKAKLQWLFVALFCATNLFSANIIFDMNGVLVTQAGEKSFWAIGPSRFCGSFNPFHIEDTLFDFLNTVIARRPDTPRAMNKKRLLPQIMCDWLAGQLTSAQVRELVTKKLQELAPSIDSQRKVKLMQAIVDFIFTPERFAKVIKPLKQGVKILKKCYRQKNAQGQRAHKIFIITNWDEESFPFLYQNKKIRKILDFCDGIIISGVVHHIKPGKEIFEYAFEDFGIDPIHELTCYIDDELCNINAARSLTNIYRQLKCIHCYNGDFASVDKALHRFEIY